MSNDVHDSANEPADGARSSRAFARRLILLVLIGIGVNAAVFFAPSLLTRERKTPELVPLATGGTSVTAFLVDNQWKALYREAKGVDVQYASSGSTEGINKMIDGEYAIGFTHTRITDEQRERALKKRGEVVQVPVVICAVVPLYNLPTLRDKAPVNFTGETLAGIFLGRIKRWNDPALKADNPEIDLPDLDIAVVHRSDSSGTTHIFAEYLEGASATWKNAIGPAKSKIAWPVGAGVERNNGIAQQVYVTPGAIGYADLLYTHFGDLQFGSVRNRDGDAFIHAKAENMTAAVHGVLADIPDDRAFGLTNARGKGAYPICGLVWAVCYRKQTPADRRKIADFLSWTLHEGQGSANEMACAQLPEELVKRAEEQIKTIEPSR